MGQQPHLIKNHSDTKSKRVNESVVPGFEEESIEDEHLLSEPQSDHVSVDGAPCFDKENSGKNFKTDDFGFDYGWKYSWGLDYDMLGGSDIKLEVIDGWLGEVDEIDDNHAANTLSCAYDDFLLDVKLPEKFCDLDYDSHEGSNVGSSSSESHSPGSGGNSNITGGISESPVATAQESDGKNDLLAKSVIFELQETSEDNPGCEVPVTDEMNHSEEELHSPSESDDDDKPLVNLILPNNKAKDREGVCYGQKRLRKPTQRYIDESSKFSSAAQGKRLKVQHDNELSEGPSESRLLRGRPKKVVSKLETQSDDEYTASDYEDDDGKTKRSKSSGDRRKHQRMWTLDEVVKLVDGISEFGLGKWTAIKRLLFASSTYRTPIDLRDKWRNLVRSTCGHKENRKEVENNPKHTVRCLPKTVLRRIQELASIHQFPKVCNRKLDHVSPTRHTSRAKVAQLSLRKSSEN